MASSFVCGFHYHGVWLEANPHTLSPPTVPNMAWLYASAKSKMPHSICQARLWSSFERAWWELTWGGTDRWIRIRPPFCFGVDNHTTPFHCVVAEAHYLWQKTSINIDFSKNNGTLSQLGCLLLELTREPLEPSLDNRMYWHEFSYQQYFRIQSWFIATSLCPNGGGSV